MGVATLVDQRKGRIRRTIKWIDFDLQYPFWRGLQEDRMFLVVFCQKYSFCAYCTMKQTNLSHWSKKLTVGITYDYLQILKNYHLK